MSGRDQKKYLLTLNTPICVLLRKNGIKNFTVIFSLSRRKIQQRITMCSFTQMISQKNSPTDSLLLLAERYQRVFSYFVWLEMLIFITWILQKKDATKKFQSIPKHFCHKGILSEFHVSKISNVESVTDLKLKKKNRVFYIIWKIWWYREFLFFFFFHTLPILSLYLASCWPRFQTENVKTA